MGQLEGRSGVQRADWLRRADRRRAGLKFRDGGEEMKENGREARVEEEQQLYTRCLEVLACMSSSTSFGLEYRSNTVVQSTRCINRRLRRMSCA